MRLSDGIIGGRSIASVSVAATKSGMRFSMPEGYKALTIRNSLVPVVNIASNLAWPMALIGLLIGSMTGTMIFDIAIILYAVAVLFQVITLPVELNASSRAIQQLNGLGILSDGEEQSQAKRMLAAAALTYIAAAAVAVVNLLRLILIRNNND